MDKVFEKTYRIGPRGEDELRVKLKYNLIYTDHELDMDVITLGKLEFGYEDEDQLTFYPNVFKLEFNDYQRKNFHTLKFAFGETPLGNFESNHSGEIYLNGDKIFEGYIDKKTLRYDEDKRHIEFDLVDYTVRLRQKTVDGQPQDWSGGIRDILLIYRQVYPGLNINVTQDVDEYTGNTFNGALFRHNWVFRGNGTIGVPNFDVSWADPTGWEHVLVFRQRLYENSVVFSDLLKNYAREFGMIIGSGGINKIHIVKRFVNPSSFVSRRIDSYLKNYSTEIWLGNVAGVRNIPLNNADPPLNVVTEGTFVTVDGTLNGAPKDQDNVIDMRTILSRQQGTSNTGVANIKVTQGSNVQSVLNGIYDPDLTPAVWRGIERIITRYTYLARVRPREKFELDLTGINYYMHEYYSMQLEDIPSVTLRPIHISKDILKRSTEMQALEVGL